MTAVAAERELETLVAEKVRLADGVVALTLRSPDGGELPGWEPGAHIDLVLPGGLARQYSLCGDPADRRAWRVAVLREPDGRGGSRYVHDELDGGVRVRGPRNHFPLLPAARYVFVAGGIGITPILPMVARAEAEGVPWRLLYGGRTRSSMAFLDELSPYGEKVVVAPQDERGLLDLASWLPAPEAGTRVYCCGPEPLLAAVEDRCAQWPADTLQTERFTPRAVAAPVLANGFAVVLSASGRTLTVPPDRSILEVVEAAGVPVLSSCQEGTCGTCETAVVEGVPDHRDSVLSHEERAAGDVMMICVSRSCTDRLVLDL